MCQGWLLWWGRLCLGGVKRPQKRLASTATGRFERGIAIILSLYMMVEISSELARHWNGHWENRSRVHGCGLPNTKQLYGAESWCHR